jgi:hypothetical protein
MLISVLQFKLLESLKFKMNYIWLTLLIINQDYRTGGESSMVFDWSMFLGV